MSRRGSYGWPSGGRLLSGVHRHTFPASAAVGVDARSPRVRLSARTSRARRGSCPRTSRERRSTRRSPRFGRPSRIPGRSAFRRRRARTSRSIGRAGPSSRTSSRTGAGVRPRGSPSGSSPARSGRRGRPDRVDRPRDVADPCDAADPLADSIEVRPEGEHMVGRRGDVRRKRVVRHRAAILSSGALNDVLILDGASRAGRPGVGFGHHAVHWRATTMTMRSSLEQALHLPEGETLRRLEDNGLAIPTSTRWPRPSMTCTAGSWPTTTTRMRRTGRRRRPSSTRSRSRRRPSNGLPARPGTGTTSNSGRFGVLVQESGIWSRIAEAGKSCAVLGMTTSRPSAEAGREHARTLQREHRIQLSREDERGAGDLPDERTTVGP